jgi:hypothetical protein
MLTITPAQTPRTFDCLKIASGADSVKRRALAEKTVEWFFHDNIYPNLPVDKFAELFCDGNGRPTKDLRNVIGLMILQELGDLTNEGALQKLAFDTLTQYALHIMFPIDSLVYFCPKTYYNHRRKILDNGLFPEIFEEVTMAMYWQFGYDSVKDARIDSTHVLSNMRNLTRGQIFVRTTRNFLSDLEKADACSFASVPSEIVGRYVGKKTSDGCFGSAKPSGRQGLLETMAGDVHALVTQFKGEG